MPEHEKYMEIAYDALESARILFESRKYNASISQFYLSFRSS